MFPDHTRILGLLDINPWIVNVLRRYAELLGADNVRILQGDISDLDLFKGRDLRFPDDHAQARYP